MLKRGDTATMCGIERAEGTPLFGKLVVPLINIRRSIKTAHTAGKLRHGTKVKILRSKRNPWDGRRIYYRVRSDDGGQVITGWVPHTFIKEHQA